MADSTQQILVELAKAMEDDSQRRKNAISSASANMTRGRMDQTAQDEVALGQERRYQPGGTPPPPETPRELGIRSQALRSGVANGDSTDELRNYAMLQRARRVGPMSSAPRVDLAAAEQRAAGDVRAPQEGPGYRDMSPARIGEQPFNIDSVANPYGRPSAGPQQGYRPDGGPPGPQSSNSPGKERQLAEIDAAAEKAIADMNAIPATAPGAKQALAQSLEQRVKAIASALATPSSAVDQSFAGGPQAPAMGTPTAAPQAQGAPMARFPMPAYPPPVAYPTPPPPNTAGLDQAALQQFMNARNGGMGGM